MTLIGRSAVFVFLIALFVESARCGSSTQSRFIQSNSARPPVAILNPVTVKRTAKEACAAAVGGNAEPLGEYTGADLAVHPGDIAEEPVFWGDEWRRDGEPLSLIINSISMKFIPLVYPGDGYAVAILKALPETQNCIFGTWAYSFGGKGIEFVDMTRIADADNGSARIQVRLIAWCRGYYPNIDDTDFDTDSYIPPEPSPMQIVFETDGTSLRFIDESDSISTDVDEYDSYSQTS